MGVTERLRMSMGYAGQALVGLARYSDLEFGTEYIEYVSWYVFVLGTHFSSSFLELSIIAL